MQDVELFLCVFGPRVSSIMLHGYRGGGGWRRLRDPSPPPGVGEAQSPPPPPPDDDMTMTNFGRPISTTFDPTTTTYIFVFSTSIF